MITPKTLTLIVVILVITGSIFYLESRNPQKARTSATDITKSDFPKYREIVNPSGYVNTDKITIGELIGKKIILVDFWTYSCINCQRTSPILNAWYEKYRDKGLEIIGIHTPEFEFEKNIENVRDATKEVYLVASSENLVQVRVKLDGQLVGSQKGEDVGVDGVMTIKEDRLYKIIEDSTYGIHTLELQILSPGLKAFAFTFG